MQLRTVLCVIGCSALGAFAAAPPSALNNSDKKFLEMAANTDMLEAHLGQMAESSASATGVRDFAQTLTRDHTNSYESLYKLAGTIGATIPKGIDVRRDKDIMALTHLKGNNFDQTFLRDEVRDHQTALVQFKREAEHGHDADVRAYASKMVPILESHLHTAQSLEKPARHAS
jgi:putative membrane protein